MVQVRPLQLRFIPLEPCISRRCLQLPFVSAVIASPALVVVQEFLLVSTLLSCFPQI